MNEAPKKKLGRPKKEINFSQLERLLERQWTLKDVAEFFDTTVDVIEFRVKENYQRTFLELKREKAALGKAHVIEKIVELGLIKEQPWALKMLAVNWLGYTHRPDVNVTNITVTSSEEVKEVANAGPVDLIAEYRQLSSSGS